MFLVFYSIILKFIYLPDNILFIFSRNFHMPMLKVVCEVLDLEKKGTKDEVAERVMAFCMAPKSTGKKVPQSKKRKRMFSFRRLCRIFH